MSVIRSIKSMQRTTRELAVEGKTIGLVPTMGFLHEGHLALIRRATREADAVIATIFVNPTQFAPNEDLSRYPRDERGDIRKARQAGADILFLPRTDGIYPEDFQTWVTVEELTQKLEGKARPSHFRGVTTIVAKLFNICRPDVAVFGMKDFQQAAVLRQMTRDLGYPIKFIIAPTVRGRGGLARSSRNKYLDDSQRCEARCLYYALRTAKAMVRSGVTRAAAIRKEMKAVVKSVCRSAELEYIAFNDQASLAERREVVPGTVCSLAVRVHGVRLIDNMRLL